MRFIRLAVLLNVLVAGCVVQGKRIPETAEGIASSVKRTEDPYTQTITVMAEPFVLNHTRYLLRSIKSTKTNDEAMQIYISCWKTDWVFLERAADSRGNALKVSVIDREVLRDGTVTEIVGVEVSREYLENHARTGIDLRIDGKRGKLPLFLPGWYVSGFLQAVGR